MTLFFFIYDILLFGYVKKDLLYISEQTLSDSFYTYPKLENRICNEFSGYVSHFGYVWWVGYLM